MQTEISAAAWRLVSVLYSNPQAAAGGAAVLDQADLLPVFGGDEDLLSAAIDELLIIPLRLDQAAESWSELRVLASVRIELRGEAVLVYYRFHRDFLSLIKTLTP